MKDQLSRLEGHLEKLVEGSLARLLGEGLSASGVAGQTAPAMYGGVRKEAGGRVISGHSSNPLEFTQSMSKEPGTTPGKVPGGAFLILDNGQHFPLDRPVINIGRRIDNQIVLEDQHVSRTHAQLRVRDGRFVLFDLGSPGRHR